MKIKHILLAASAVVATQALTSCSQDPMYVSENEEYTREFIKQFGLIDPNQDWNLAEKASVTVNVGNHADLVKVYANIDQKYYLMARYQDVSGSVTIPFSAPASVTDLLVKIDKKQYKTHVGGTVDITGTRSRTIASSAQTPQTVGRYTITVSDAGFTMFNAQQLAPITSPDVWGDYYSLNTKQIQHNDLSVNGGKGLIPESGTSDAVGNRNNQGIIQNFTVTPTDGKFTFYPVYWNTSHSHTLGIYLIDENGNVIVDGEGQVIRIPIALDKVTTDINYWDKSGHETEIVCYLNSLPSDLDSKYKDADGNYTFNRYLSNGAEVFEELFAELLERLDELNFIKDYSSTPIELDFSTYTYKPNSVKNEGGPTNVWIEMTFTLNAQTKEDENMPDALVMDEGKWVNANNGNEAFNTTYPLLVRAKGYTIDLGEDFNGSVGMYIEFDDNGVNRIHYSQSALNDFYYQKGDSYACTFKHPMSDRIYFSFEDWANTNSYGDNDLNDLVFLLQDVAKVGDGDTEIIVTPDPEPDPTPTPDPEDPDEDDEAFEWRLAIEDLGSTDDFDFNDIVLGITAVSTNKTPEDAHYFKGEDTKTGTNISIVTFKALAAGGTLPIKLCYNGTEIANAAGNTDWHSWFGDGTIEVTTMINTGRGVDAEGTEVTYLFKDFNLNEFLAKDDAVGSGFKVMIEDATTGAISVVQPEGAGNAPQMFIVPGNAWRWPTERTNIKTAYDDFIKWVGDSETYKNWYQTPNAGTVY